MPTTTPNRGFPKPLPADGVDVPRDVGALADSLDVFAFVPVGTLLMWPGAVAPAGYLLAQGQSVPAATYPGLASVLGSSGGNVTLPDMRDMFPIGASPAHALASTGGEATHRLTAAESGQNASATGGTDQSGAHAHSVHYNYGPAGGVANLPFYEQAGHQFDTWVGTDAAGNHSHVVGMNGRQADTAHNNLPPFRALNFIIRAG